MADSRNRLLTGLPGCREVLRELFVDYGRVDDLPNPLFVSTGKEY